MFFATGAVQVDVAGLLWELDAQEGCVTASLCSQAPSPANEQGAVTAASPAGAVLGVEAAVVPTEEAGQAQGSLFEAVQQRNGLLHRVVDTIHRLQVDMLRRISYEGLSAEFLWQQTTLS